MDLGPLPQRNKHPQNFVNMVIYLYLYSGLNKHRKFLGQLRKL
jgi:hypothetical protein